MNGETVVQQRARILGVVLTLGVLTACGTSNADTTTSSSIPVPTPASEIVTSTMQTTPAVQPLPTQDIGLRFTAADGSIVKAMFKLSPIVPAGDARIPLNFNGTPPCDGNDETRDGVTVGYVTLENESPGFSASMKLMFNPKNFQSGPNNINIGVQYGNEPYCDDLDSINNSSAIRPNFTGTVWGPVPVEFVFHNVFTPTSPRLATGVRDIVASAVQSESEGGVYSVRLVGPPEQRLVELGPGSAATLHLAEL